MNILSLFDGISAGRLALQRAGIEVETYYRSEVNKFANKVAMHHFPNDTQLGDVTKWREWDIDWSGIDMLIGGSPCQGFSFAGKQAGTLASVNGEMEIVATREKYLKLKARKENLENIIFLSESYLFWEYVLILDHIKSHNPNVKFLLENVKMKKELLQMIDDAMGVKSVVINSALLSAQNRVRHYWCNWEVNQPEDKGILLKDILEHGDTADRDKSLTVTTRISGATAKRYLEKSMHQMAIISGNDFVDRDKSYCIDANYAKGGNPEQYFSKSRRQLVFRPCERINEKTEGHIANATDIKGMDCIKRVYHPNGKAPTLTTMGGGHREPKVAVSDITYRKLTPLECERLQTLPDFWTDCVSNTQRYKAIGNGWTIDVIAHILGAV